MKDESVKKEFRMFLLTDYEAEEVYLAKRHKEGYAFEHVKSPGFYTFQKCEPEEVVYRLDFHPLDKSERESYLQMYQDYGWEYVDEMNDYCYFRKAVDKMAEGESLEIFADLESKLDMVKQIFWRRMFQVLVVMLFIVVPQIYRTVTGQFTGELGFIWSVFWSVVFVLYVYICIHCGIGFYKLRKKYSRKTD